jgi:hypothetical protein
LLTCSLGSLGYITEEWKVLYAEGNNIPRGMG